MCKNRFEFTSMVICGTVVGLGLGRLEEGAVHPLPTAGVLRVSPWSWYWESPGPCRSTLLRTSRGIQIKLSRSYVGFRTDNRDTGYVPQTDGTTAVAVINVSVTYSVFSSRAMLLVEQDQIGLNFQSTGPLGESRSVWFHHPWN